MSTPTKVRQKVRKNTVVPLDLYDSGDQLAPASLKNKRDGQTASRPASTLPSSLPILAKSGWLKPTIQLAMLIGLRRQDLLTVGGERRFHRMLASQSTSVISAAHLRSEKISTDPSFDLLRQWVNRPFSFHQFHKKEKRRIGVGYRDKGTLPPSHRSGRNQRTEDSIWIGKHMEYIWTLRPDVALLVQDYGYLFHHEGDGWWVPDHRLRYLMIVRRLVS